MTSVSSYHNMAMEFADLGLRSRARGDGARALAYFKQALDWELAAMAELGRSDGLAWSILHRSAGTLALDCRQFRLAEQITARALAGEPHPDIVDELRDLWEQIHFQRELDRHGIAVRDGELQLSLSGPEVGNGLAPYNEIYGRVDNTATLITRTAERKSGREFRERGSPAKEIRENYRTLVSVPRQGSFAVTLKFGNPIQGTLPGMFDTTSVVDEFMDLLGLLNSSRIRDLQDLIPDPAYLRNFFGLAKKIAPDGERVRQVGFIVKSGDKERSVALTTPSAELVALSLPAIPNADAEPVTMQGVLRYADATPGSGDQIRVVDIEKDVTHRVQVPTGMMNDIVRPMWDRRVVITGMLRGNVVTLATIDPDDSDSDG